MGSLRPPRLSAAVAAIETGTHQIILAERFDRLFRNLDVQREAIRRVEAAGGRLETVKQGAISHATAETELYANVDGMVAQYIRRTAKERSWAAVEIAVEEGRSASPIPLGYQRDANKVLVPDDPETVKIVQEAFELRASGKTYREVRDYLADHGIKRTIGGVTKMLASRLYVGEVHFGKHTPNLKAHEAIIERDLFDRVQRTRVRAGRKGKSERLLARLGVLRCGTCGGRMSVSRHRTGYPFYRCANRGECQQPRTIGAEIVERLVVDKVKFLADEIRGRASVQAEAIQAQEQADADQRALAKLIEGLTAAGVMGEPESIAAVTAAREKRDASRAHARQVVDRSAALRVSSKAWDLMTLAEQRDLIRGPIDRVEVNAGKGPSRVKITPKDLG